YEHDCTVMAASDGETGLEIAIGHEFDVIILDIGLPRLDGYGVMQALRTRSRSTPVLMLTARDAEDEIIRGLDAGADDYLTKPFSFSELVARLQAVTRSHRQERDGKIAAGDVVLDLARRSVTRNRTSIDLTRQEFLLLNCLMLRSGQCVPRKTLMEFVWGPDRSIGATALDVLVNSLRAKIDSHYDHKLVGTVRGSGYVFQGTVSVPERAAL
ncbi:MAG: response regulator transcription factor, partial [Terracidiphilus sp.]